MKLSEQVAQLENELERRIATPSPLARGWEYAYYQLLKRCVDERMAMLMITNPEMYQFLNTPIDELRPAAPPPVARAHEKE